MKLWRKSKSKTETVDYPSHTEIVDRLHVMLVAGRHLAADDLRRLAVGKWYPLTGLLHAEAKRLDSEALASAERLEALAGALREAMQTANTPDTTTP